MKILTLIISLLITAAATLRAEETVVYKKIGGIDLKLFIDKPADWKASDHRPAIVYILCDDLGYGDVHCLNPQRGKIATPHLDKFASQGMTGVASFDID